MSVKFEDFKLNEKITKALPDALSMLAEQVRNDSDRFVPMLTGDLRTYVDIDKEDNKASLVYDSKYASYQWFGVGIKNYTTAGTGPEWCEVARRLYGSDWETVLANAIKQKVNI